MTETRRAKGTKHPNIVCRYCAHNKTWHPKEGKCRIDLCDCEAWDYGTNVIEVEQGLQPDAALGDTK